MTFFPPDVVMNNGMQVQFFVSTHPTAVIAQSILCTAITVFTLKPARNSGRPRQLTVAFRSLSTFAIVPITDGGYGLGGYTLVVVRSVVMAVAIMAGVVMVGGDGIVNAVPPCGVGGDCGVANILD